jgi:hypothetical protein
LSIVVSFSTKIEIYQQKKEKRKEKKDESKKIEKLN